MVLLGLIFGLGNPEPKELISSSEPPGSFPAFNKNLKNDEASEEDYEEPSEVSTITLPTVSKNFILRLVC